MKDEKEEILDYAKYHKYVLQVATIVRIRVLNELIEPIIKKGVVYTVYEQAKFEAIKSTLTNYLMSLFGKGTNDKMVVNEECFNLERILKKKFVTKEVSC